MSNFGRAVDCCQRLGVFTSGDIADEAGITQKFASGYIWMLIRAGLVVRTEKTVQFRPGKQRSILYRWHSFDAGPERHQAAKDAPERSAATKCASCGVSIGQRRAGEAPLCFKPSCREGVALSGGERPERLLP